MTARRQKQFEAKAQPLEKAATNATITRENGAFVITDEVQGKTIDAEASVKAIETYLNKKWNKKEASVDLVSVSDVPDVTREQLETIQDTLGTFTTYCGSGGGRVQNIESGTAHINGAVVMPGEEYSATQRWSLIQLRMGLQKRALMRMGRLCRVWAAESARCPQHFTMP